MTLDTGELLVTLVDSQNVNVALIIYDEGEISLFSPNDLKATIETDDVLDVTLTFEGDMFVI